MTHTRFARQSITAALGAILLATASLAQSPTAGLASLDVFPADVNLTTSRDRQSFVVQATYADGLTRDVTAEAKVSVANPALIKLEKNVVHPVADGATEMKVEFGGKAVQVKVSVKDAKVE